MQVSVFATKQNPSREQSVPSALVPVAGTPSLAVGAKKMNGTAASAAAPIEYASATGRGSEL